MNPYFLLRILYGVFLGSAFVITGILTITSKGEPGVGFRIGYTYLSERARKKVNRITGIGLILLGVLFMLSSVFLPLYAMFVLLIAGVAVLLIIGYTVAKGEYELEELSRNVPGKPGRRIEPPRVGKYAALQGLFAGFSLTLLIAGEIPKESGILYIAFIQLFLLGLTVLFSRPLVFQLAPKFRGKMALGFARAMTIVSGVLTLEVTIVALKPNADPLVGVLFTFISLGAIFYAAFVALTSAYEEGYY